jgi:hypothetical protein
MLKLIKAIIIAIKNQKPYQESREVRRKDKKYKGRVNPNGKFFGGVESTKQKRLERYCAGKLK